MRRTILLSMLALSTLATQLTADPKSSHLEATLIKQDLAADLNPNLSVRKRTDPSAICFESEDGSVTIRSDFPGGRISGCRQITDDEFELVIQPERKPINDSAWYAFKIESTELRTINLNLRYVDGSHRYTPQVSRDGIEWELAPHLVVAEHPLGTQVKMQVDAGPAALWISAQELMDNNLVYEWSESLTNLPFVNRQEIGESVLGRPLSKLEITESKTTPAYIFLMGRQHPPEVSGMIGMMRFVETIAGDSKLAAQFRKHFCTVVVPTANPDGVARGHWRCNAAGVDLNRDWGHFTQPETQAIRRELMACRTAGPQSLYLFLDFHSTFNDVFYTSADIDDAFPRGFASTWLEAFQERFPWYEVNHDANHNGNRSTSKVWVRRTLDVASVTYEFGDNTDRNTIAQLAEGNAQEMMKLLLKRRISDLNQSQIARMN